MRWDRHEPTSCRSTSCPEASPVKSGSQWQQAEYGRQFRDTATSAHRSQGVMPTITDTDPPQRDVFSATEKAHKPLLNSSPNQGNTRPHRVGEGYHGIDLER